MTSIIFWLIDMIYALPWTQIFTIMLILDARHLFLRGIKKLFSKKKTSLD